MAFVSSFFSKYTIQVRIYEFSQGEVGNQAGRRVRVRAGAHGRHRGHRRKQDRRRE